MSFFETHGNGFWLHMLGAVAIMAVGWWTGWLLVALIINTLFWPVREKVQKGKNADWSVIFTSHKLLEWVPAVAVGFICAAISTLA